MHSNLHLGISLMAMAHLAATTPNLTYACDTHYPWVEDDDEVRVGGKIAFQEGCIIVGDAPGLGVALDQERLRRAHQAFLDTTIRSRDDTAQMRRYAMCSSIRTCRSGDSRNLARVGISG